MADTLCGPANPLQAFQKHAQADRSLQQDRFVSRQQHGGQGFRSENYANVGLFDHEFEAFQAGQLPSGPPELHDTLPPQLPANNFPALPQPTPAASGWAADFAKLHISPLAHQPAREFQEPQPSLPSWHEDFNRAQIAAIDPTSLPQQSYQPHIGSMTSASAFQSLQQPFRYVPPSLQSLQPSSEARWKGKGRWHPEEAAQDTAAFEREFEALAQETIEGDEVSQQTSKGPEVDIGQDAIIQAEETSQGARETLHRMNEEQQRGEMAQDEQAPAQVAGAEGKLSANGLLPPGEPAMETMREIPTRQATPIVQQEEPQAQPQSSDQQPEVDEELAHTAGLLLNNVADNQSEKFQQSSFFSLMREFRDYEKKVEGDKVVDVVSSSQEATPKAATPQQDADLGRLPPEDHSMTGALPPAATSYSAHVEKVADQMGKCHIPPP